MQAGANPNIADRNGDTALHLAIRLRFEAVARLLVGDRRTELTRRNAGGKTPAMLLMDQAKTKNSGSSSSSELLAVLERAAVAETERERRRQAAMNFLVYGALATACFGVTVVRQYPACAGVFEHLASAFLLPLFGAALAYSFFG